MPIETQCPQCAKQLRVPDTAAGKRIRCPSCKMVISLPVGSPPPGGRPPMAASARPPAPAMWSVQTEDGQQYGPITKVELDQWVAEGRITGSCQLLRSGGTEWQWAFDVYPQLSAAPAVFAGTPPMGQKPAPGGPMVFSDNPYASPSSGSSAMRGRRVPNHLPLAIFSLICCGGLFAIPGIIFAVQANSKKAAGDYAGAAREAAKAQTWILIAIGIGSVLTLLSIVAQVALQQ